MKGRKKLKRFIWFCLILFIVINVVAYLHAYKLTHFSSSKQQRTKQEKLSSLDKINILFTGVSNPRPVNNKRPLHPYQTIYLKSNKIIECWLINTDHSEGTIILFHGYGGEKSSMLDKAELFLKMGYNTLLVDFMGSGGSEGSITTIGFKEAEEVKTCFDYCIHKGEKRVFLFGTSMGAVSIMKAISDYHLQPSGIIIECPFGTMYQTVCARFNNLHVPTFPMAGLLVFWGGVQNGFWAFSHNPEQYAKSVICPTLLLYGEKDEKVSRKEINTIYAHLKGQKKLCTFPMAGHENYLSKYAFAWNDTVRAFISGSRELTH